MASDLAQTYPMVESRERVCGGEPCLVRTRMPVWVLERARRLGTTEAEILRCFPTLRPADLAAAWDYVRAHKAQVDEQIRANEEA